MVLGRHFLMSLVFGAALLAPSAPGAAPLPTGIKAEPFYDQSKVNFNGCKTIWMEEVPGFAKHFWVLSQEGQIFSLYPSGTDYAKAEIANFKTKVNFFPRSEYGAYNVIFHPQFRENKKFYVLYLGVPAQNPYTHRSGGNVILEEWLAEDVLTGKIALQRKIFSFTHKLSYGTSKALFGPEGYLYVSISDYAVHGGDLKTWGRKLIRIDVDKKDPGLEYAIPTDNPYFNNPDASIKKEIWASGFRNAWSLTFDPWTKDLWLGDVSETDWEELNIVEKGGNYAWGAGGNSESTAKDGISGMCGTSKLKAECAKYKDPIYAFSYTSWASQDGVAGLKCINAGRFFRGDPSSPFYGHLIFADHHLDRIGATKKGVEPQVVGDVSVISNRQGHDGIAHIAEDSFGNLYAVFISWTLGKSYHIYKLSHPDLRPSATPVNVLDRKGRWAGSNARKKLNIRLGSDLPTGYGTAFTLDGRAIPEAAGGRLPKNGLFLTVAQEQEIKAP